MVAFLQFAFLALGLTSGLLLFLNLKREMHTQARINRIRWDEVLTLLRLGELTPKPPPPASRPPMTTISGMNQNTRIQAVRLLRRGADVSHIAAAFGVPRSEVELLVRVHQLSTKRAAQAAPEASYSASSLSNAVRTTDTTLTMSAPKNAAPNPST